VRQAHPKLAGLILSLSDEPQSTRAWERGAVGEELLANRLDGLTDAGLLVLHDRAIPGSRANIDHIAVSAAGVFVIDAKRYTGRPHLRVEGGLLRPRTETLMVGKRNCEKLVDGVIKQVGLVRAALESVLSLQDVPVRGVLCFVEADWPLIGGAFTTREIAVVWPAKLSSELLAPRTVPIEVAVATHRHLATSFPVA
jgi:hypothetical protein